MYYFFFALNCLVILFITYILVFAPDELATGQGQRAIPLAIGCLVGLLLLTAASIYFKTVRHTQGIAAWLLVISWVLIILSIIKLLSKQKWM